MPDDYIHRITLTIYTKNIELFATFLRTGISAIFLVQANVGIRMLSVCAKVFGYLHTTRSAFWTGGLIQGPQEVVRGEGEGFMGSFMFLSIMTHK